MKADFTRNTFDPQKNFLRVLMQQGRVQLDADFNEQISILLNYMQTLAADLIGPHGGPEHDCGFKIIWSQVDIPKEEEEPLEEKLKQLGQGDFLIGKGRYYVDGLLCENEHYVSLYSATRPVCCERTRSGWLPSGLPGRLGTPRNGHRGRRHPRGCVGRTRHCHPFGAGVAGKASAIGAGRRPGRSRTGLR
jgi:hypothetical protein